jgi:pyruvate-ferredoxin/flavodoxin oxidoreductase
MLLKKANYHAMVGGDGACMGCGEKTVIHLLVATIEAALQPHVSRFVARLNELISRLEAKVRLLLAADADLEHLPADGQVALAVSDEQRGQVAHLTELLRRLKDLRWRYTTGPGGRGRSSLGMTNATGCSSVWGSTYPYNPYPFPWVNHLFQDAPSIAIGIFEGQARKMADAFATVRRVELELEDAYDPAVHDALFEAFDWRSFTEEEHRLCPPIVAVGGDGAMYDIGFQNLSRLLMSGMPIRVVVLDTQVYSNTGGQACTSGFLGQVSDMAEYGMAQHGKLEQRKELSLLALAHRGAFVLQSSQASPAHLIGGLLKGLASRRPAVFNLYSPCQTEHGIADDASANSARLALESRVFPFLLYDPDAGPALADRLDLDGNPVPEDNWPTHSLAYRAEDGTEKVLTVPLTTADWAATETRFAKHFTTVGPAHADMEMVPYHEYLLLDSKDREGKRAFIHALSRDGRLCRLLVSEEMVQLGEDRQAFWSELREMAGDAVSEGIRDELSAKMEHEFEERLSALRAEHEASVQELKRTYPRLVARRMAEALLGPQDALARLTESVGPGPAAAAPKPVAAPLEAGTVEVPAASVPEVPAAVGEPTGTGKGNGQDDGLELGPWIDKPTCTSCDECIKVNPKLFVYNTDKKATITDPKLGSYKDMVTAAERCSSKSIRPGAPLNPRERNVDKWIARAAPFNT